MVARVHAPSPHRDHVVNRMLVHVEVEVVDPRRVVKDQVDRHRSKLILELRSRTSMTSGEYSMISTGTMSAITEMVEEFEY